MQLQFKLNQAEALRQGVDAPTSVVTIEINPKTLTQEERKLLADRMDGINVRELTTWGGLSAPGHSEKHITATLATFDGLMVAVRANEAKSSSECSSSAQRQSLRSERDMRMQTSKEQGQPAPIAKSHITTKPFGDAPQCEQLSELKRLLRDVLPGPIQNADVVGHLIGCWGILGGSTQESTTAEKLLGRIENLCWEPPCILFQIERHGGTVMGSSRAEIHDWAVNLDTEEAHCSTGRYRQLRLPDRALKVGPLVERVVEEIRLGKACLDLKWLATDTVRINIGHVIPATFAKTTEGRRRRFKQKLEPRLAEQGWRKLAGTGPNTYQKVAPSPAVARLGPPERAYN